jgi:3-methyladenine DNA glycosylase AlkC
MSSASPLERKLSAALAANDLDGVLAALDSVVRRLDGSAKGQQAVGAASYIKSADMGVSARLITAHLADQPRELQRWTQALLTHEHPSFRSIGAIILPALYDDQPRFVTARLLHVADDPSWITRESAGNTASHVLNEYFDKFYPVLQAWTRHKSENVRRAVVIATMSAFDRKHPQPERAEPLLRLHDVLVTDRSEYVRVNLGPFAIGAMILRHYPDATLRRLRQWARLKSEAARWNVAMVWTSIGGRKYPQEGLELLTQLATDERRFVWRAVASAMVKLARAHPALCRPVIAEWSSDSKRMHVAEAINKYLK